ncbi:MAG: 7-carboxy-7-deazaguanine synthase QueE [Fimbriimonadaceae bacterium]|nr:7-carboxy-7-deazaguanine synthase QueE [Fimbriimonadaceae bacterium]
MSRLRIAETFVSIQGEGSRLGCPSHFIRISGCNLRCRWCDTPYASWDPEGPMRTIDELLHEVRQTSVQDVVVTGGEPMLFEPVVALCEGLRELGRTITIETAGTVHRDLACDLMSISPKLANSTPDPDSGWAERHEATRLDREPLRWLMADYDCQLKFVVDPEGSLGDLAEIEEVLAELPPIPGDRIFLMAEGTDAETLHRRERLLVEEVLNRGWRLTPRHHIDLFGDARGT